MAPSKAKVVLLSPMRQGDMGRPLPDPAKQNRNLRLYADAVRDVAKKRELGFVDLYDLFGDIGKVKPVAVTENGMRFLVDLPSGQKTGFFLDQRENRRLAREVAPGRSVLNVFAYTGGFAVAAGLGGAIRVVSVETSAPALDLGRRAVADSIAGDAVHDCRSDQPGAHAKGSHAGRSSVVDACRTRQAGANHLGQLSVRREYRPVARLGRRDRRGADRRRVCRSGRRGLAVRAPP